MSKPFYYHSTDWPLTWPCTALKVQRCVSTHRRVAHEPAWQCFSRNLSWMIVRDTCWVGNLAFFHNIFYFMASLHAFTVAHCGQPVPSLSWPFTACTLRVMRVRTGKCLWTQRTLWLYHPGQTDLCGKSPKSGHRERRVWRGLEAPRQNRSWPISSADPLWTDVRANCSAVVGSMAWIVFFIAAP